MAYTFGYAPLLHLEAALSSWMQVEAQRQISHLSLSMSSATQKHGRHANQEGCQGRDKR